MEGGSGNVPTTSGSGQPFNTVNADILQALASMLQAQQQSIMSQVQAAIQTIMDSRNVKRRPRKLRNEGHDVDEDIMEMDEVDLALRSHKHKRGARDGVEGTDSDVDDEGNEGEDGGDDVDTVPHKRRTRSGEENTFHLEFRRYLQGKRVLPRKAGELPAIVSNAELAAYRDGDGPDISDIRLNWVASLTRDPWNDAAITLLANDFKTKIEQGSIAGVNPMVGMTLRYLKRQCSRKLNRTAQKVKAQRQFIRQLASTDNAEQLTHREEKAREAKEGLNRRAGRRATRAQRRVHIIAQNYGANPQIWGKVQELIETLGARGMSDDETDTEEEPKQVKRIRLHWLNESISQLFRAVDSYERVASAKWLLHRRGNTSFKRIYETSRVSTDEERAPIHYLPRNWYNQEWLKGIGKAARLNLVMRPPVDLPHLEMKV